MRKWWSLIKHWHYLVVCNFVLIFYVSFYYLCFLTNRTWYLLWSLGHSWLCSDRCWKACHWTWWSTHQICTVTMLSHLFYVHVAMVIMLPAFCIVSTTSQNTMCVCSRLKIITIRSVISMGFWIFMDFVNSSYP